MTIQLKLKHKYLRGGGNTGNHGKCGGNSGDASTKKMKHKQMPITHGSRARSFS
jgi:hypothetical protein